MVTDTLDTIVQAIKAAGIPADVDPVNLFPPCAWVHATRWLGRRLDGIDLIEVGIHIIAPELDILVVLDILETLLTHVIDTVAGCGFTVIDTDLGTTVTLPGGEVFPAFSLTIQPPI